MNQNTAPAKPFTSLVPLLNAPAVNQLFAIGKKTPYKEDIIANKATITRNTLKVFIDGFKELKGLRQSVYKLLDICTLCLTEQNRFGEDEPNPSVKVPLADYMSLCGIANTVPNTDKTRAKVKEDLDTLYHISLEWSEKRGKTAKNYAKTRICSQVGIRNSIIELRFTPEMAKYLTSSYIMRYSTDLLKLDERNHNAYSLGRKLLLHYSMKNNVSKGTSNTISVKSLLEVCPDIPDYGDVNDNHLQQRIKQPLEKALNALPFVEWEYTNKRGRTLTKEQIAAADYDTFAQLLIKFDVIDKRDRKSSISVIELML